MWQNRCDTAGESRDARYTMERRNSFAGYESWLLPHKPEHRWYGLEQDDGVSIGEIVERSQQFCCWRY